MGGGAGPGPWCLGPACAWGGLGCPGTTDVSAGCLFFFLEWRAAGWGGAFSPVAGSLGGPWCTVTNCCKSTAGFQQY